VGYVERAKERVKEIAADVRERIFNDQNRYGEAAHAVQTAIKWQMETQGTDAAGTSPKHLRVGVNMALVENSALVMLLLEKGIITDEEWYAVLADATEEEVSRLTEQAHKLGLPSNTSFR
jgi:hypothetical protein